MAIKAINNSASLDRLTPILLIFLFKIYHLVNHHFFSKFLGQRDLYCNSNGKWGKLIFIILVKWYLYINGNHKRRVASVGNNITCSYIVTCRRGNSVVRSLKLFALPHPFSKNQSRTTTIILSTNRSYVISPCETNNWRKSNTNIKYLKETKQYKISFGKKVTKNYKSLKI